MLFILFCVANSCDCVVPNLVCLEICESMNNIFPKIENVEHYLDLTKDFLEQSRVAQTKLLKNMNDYNQISKDHVFLFEGQKEVTINSISNWSNARLSFRSKECEQRLNNLPTMDFSQGPKTIVWMEKNNCPMGESILSYLRLYFSKIRYHLVPNYLLEKQEILNSPSARFLLDLRIKEFNLRHPQNEVHLIQNSKNVTLGFLRPFCVVVFDQLDISNYVNEQEVIYALSNCHEFKKELRRALEVLLPKITPESAKNYIRWRKNILQVSPDARIALRNRIDEFNVNNSTILVLRIGNIQLNATDIIDWSSAHLSLENNVCFEKLYNLSLQNLHNELLWFDQNECHDAEGKIESILSEYFPPILMNEAYIDQRLSVMHSKLAQSKLDKRVEEININNSSFVAVLRQHYTPITSSTQVKNWKNVKLEFYFNFETLRLTVPNLFKFLTQNSTVSLLPSQQNIYYLNQPIACRQAVKLLKTPQNLLVWIKNGNLVSNSSYCRFSQQLTLFRSFLSSETKALNMQILRFRLNFKDFNVRQMIKNHFSMLENDKSYWVFGCNSVDVLEAMENEVCYSGLEIRFMEISFEEWYWGAQRMHNEQRTLKMLRKFSSSLYSLSYYVVKHLIWRLHYFVQFIKMLALEFSIYPLISSGQVVASKDTADKKLVGLNIVQIIIDYAEIKLDTPYKCHFNTQGVIFCH